MRLRAEECSIDEFRATVETTTSLADYPLASEVALGAVVYDAARLREGVSFDDAADELGRVLLEGPGVLVLRGAVDAEIVDRATRAFYELIDDQKRRGQVAGDHFAKPGANDRVWNAFEKLAVEAPDVFVDYYANDMITLGAQAWLGPSYRISSQLNVVNPGGLAQEPHRDFHLGFLSDAVAERFPAHVHSMSPMLTLQGAVAHCDMPVETGPTLYLPHSQKYPAGFLAWRRPDFKAYFADHHVQLPLTKGDIVFFNPALFHAAGTNRTTDVRRMANLLQISSAMGRPMEAMDTERIARAIAPTLADRAAAGWSPEALERVVVAAADAYAFPTNLDRDPPVGGLTPPSQADLLRQYLADGWSFDRLDKELSAHTERRRSW